MFYTLGTVGWSGRFPDSDPQFAALEAERQLKAVERLLHDTQRWFLLQDAIRKLPEYGVQGRLLGIERTENGTTTLEGCVAFDQPLLRGPHPKTGQPIMRRVTVLRLLVVRESEDRPNLALRLSLEAGLRGTVRSMNDDEYRPHSMGTVGMIQSSNEAAMGWAEKLGPARCQIIEPTLHNVRQDPTLALVHRYAEDIRRSVHSDRPYSIVVANRRILIEAATLHQKGRLPHTWEENDLPVHYDSSDPFQAAIDMVADNISWENAAIFDRMGLTGRTRATVWSPRHRQNAPRRSAAA